MHTHKACPLATNSWLIREQSRLDSWSRVECCNVIHNSEFRYDEGRAEEVHGSSPLSVSPSRQPEIKRFWVRLNLLEFGWPSLWWADVYVGLRWLKLRHEMAFHSAILSAFLMHFLLRSPWIFATETSTRWRFYQNSASSSPPSFSYGTTILVGFSRRAYWNLWDDVTSLVARVQKPFPPLLSERKRILLTAPSCVSIPPLPHLTSLLYI